MGQRAQNNIVYFCLREIFCQSIFIMISNTLKNDLFPCKNALAHVFSMEQDNTIYFLI